MIKRLTRFTAIAASTLLISTAAPRKAEANPAALPGAAACIASVACVVTVAVAGGIAYWVITWQNQPEQWEEIGPIMPMLDDPEAEREILDDPVWAPNARAARRKCQAIADALTASGQPARVIESGKAIGPGQFTCKIQIEVG